MQGKKSSYLWKANTYIFRKSSNLKLLDRFHFFILLPSKIIHELRITKLPGKRISIAYGIHYSSTSQHNSGNEIWTIVRFEVASCHEKDWHLKEQSMWGDHRKTDWHKYTKDKKVKSRRQFICKQQKTRVIF